MITATTPTRQRRGTVEGFLPRLEWDLTVPGTKIHQRMSSFLAELVGVSGSRRRDRKDKDDWDLLASVALGERDASGDHPSMRKVAGAGKRRPLFAAKYC
jgi:hypothetical protein